MNRKTDFLLPMTAWEIGIKAAQDVALYALGFGCAFVMGMALCLYFVNL